MNVVLQVLANGLRWDVGGSKVAGVAEKWWCGGCGCAEASRGQTEESIIYDATAEESKDAGALDSDTDSI